MKNYKVIYTYLEGNTIHAKTDITLADSAERAANNIRFWHTEQKELKIIKVYRKDEI